MGRDPKEGHGGVAVGLRTAPLAVLLKSQIFRTVFINILCYVSKTGLQTDFCEVHVISIILIWFLLGLWSRKELEVFG